MAVEAPAAPPPTAPAAAPAATVPAPMSTNTTGVEPLPVPSTPPRPGSARERMRQQTAGKWEGETTTPRPGEKPAEPPAPKVEPKPGEKTAPKPADPSTEAPPDITPEQKKQNPWKLFRQEKSRAETLERELSEIKSKGVSDEERASLTQKLTKAEEKLKSYEDEIRFRAYEKSDEFRNKYEIPYERAWEKHMKDLRGVPVTTEDGSSRPMVPNDILDLVNLELPDARKLASEKFGDFAQDAMAARKEIRDLFEAKSTALEEAKKNGADREKQFQENAKAWRDKVQKHIAETWKSENDRAQSNPKNAEFFKPVEGDDPDSVAHNEALQKGYAQVDEAFSLNPMDPKLSDADREKAVRKHAIIRNRSAAFGVMKLIIQKLRKQNAEFDKTIKELKGSAPPAGGGAPPAAPGSAPGSARDRMHAAGDKYARG